jgi:Na+-transporting methylmalonyl-CoA/oxaloacetate decarboxylase gamma subunit
MKLLIGIAITLAGVALLLILIVVTILLVAAISSACIDFHPDEEESDRLEGRR